MKHFHGLFCVVFVLEFNNTAAVQFPFLIIVQFDKRDSTNFLLEDVFDVHPFDFVGNVCSLL